jgi:hypothetical protein
MNSNCLKENLKEIEKLVAGPRWTPDTKTDWPTNCRRNGRLIIEQILEKQVPCYVALTLTAWTQNYWVTGLRPSPGILNTIKHEDLETGPVFFFRWGEGGTYSFWSQQSVSLPSPEDGNRWSFRNVVLSSIQNSGRCTKSRNPVQGLVRSWWWPISLYYLSACLDNLRGITGQSEYLINWIQFAVNKLNGTQIWWEVLQCTGGIETQLCALSALVEPK